MSTLHECFDLKSLFCFTSQLPDKLEMQVGSSVGHSFRVL